MDQNERRQACLRDEQREKVSAKQVGNHDVELVSLDMVRSSDIHIKFPTPRQDPRVVAIH